MEFIADIRFHGTYGVLAEYSVETMRSLFEAGYCYYFAKMLETTFPCGEACICYQFSHVVYVLDEVAYDISGVTDAEYEKLVRFNDLPIKHTNGFLHVPCLNEMASKEDLEIAVGSLNEVFAISAYSNKIRERSKFVCEVAPAFEFANIKTAFSLERNRLHLELENGNITQEQFE